MEGDVLSGATGTPEVIWFPQAGPQTALATCPVYEIFYGGARGGGKTDGFLFGDWLPHAHRYGQQAIGAFFRQTGPQLDGALRRAAEIYPRLGAKWTGAPKRHWRFPNGALFQFRSLDADVDATNYQGHSFTRLYFDELPNFADPSPVMKLKATLRSAQGVPVGFRASGNPGGAGHGWVKARYIDPCPDGYEIITDDDGMQRVFIPARVSDNQKLLENDPFYVTRLRQSGSATLVRAWVDGDWSVVEGAYFDCWSSGKHVVRPFEIPGHWMRFRSLDWGSAAPFSVGWWAIAGEDYGGDGRIIPKGSMVRYREWYGAASPNVGLKMPAEDVAREISRIELGEKIAYGVADPSIFASDGGPSIAERMLRHRVTWRRADNKRVSGMGQMGGWDAMRRRLTGEEDGRPLLYVFSTCAAFIRTVPAMQHDARHPEDVDTRGEDHCADEVRYACMSRPWTIEKPKGGLFHVGGRKLDWRTV